MSRIQFFDAFILIPTQIGMISSITVIYGMELSKGFLIAFLSTTLGSAGATVLGKTVVSNVMKFIPGVGTAVSGAISGSSAGLLITALGLAYIQMMEMIARGEISKEEFETKEGKEKMKNIFKNQLKKNEKPSEI